MNRIMDRLVRAGALVLAVMLSPTALYADDTEIFFSRAQADNEQNEPIANVFIMLDTSGSMRFCENNLAVSGHNATWCSDYTKRRINILQDALKEMLKDAPDGVRIGIGRFNFLVPSVTSGTGGTGQIGGRVLVPVVDVNDATRKIFDAEIAKLNDAGNAASGQAGAQPVGDTPTARAYSEAVRYMMGMTPRFGVAANGAQNGICLETATREVDCVDVFDGWSEWKDLELGVCDPLDPACRVELGAPQPIAGTCDLSLESCSADYGPWTAIGGSCNLLESSVCRVNYGPWVNAAGTCDVSLPTCQYGAWGSWVVTRESGATTTNCPNVNQPTFERRRETVCTRTSIFGICNQTAVQCQERSRGFQTRAENFEARFPTQYYQREATFFTREALYRKECGIETYCANYADIVKGGKYVSPINMANQCESNHVILFTDGAPSANDTAGDQGFTNCGTKNSYDCQVQISEYLHSDSNAMKRKVKTYNIGLYMGTNQTNMERVSTDGAEGTINADDSEQLIKAFASIIDLIADNSRSFSAPGVAVNQMNRLQHLDQLYYAVFEPRKSSYWDGNLKRYRVVDSEIRAQNGPAVDPQTGFFADNARSFWSSETDGPDVRKGGAREQLADRRLFYSDAAGLTKQLNWQEDNDPTLFGLPASATAEQVEELKNRLRTNWGDPLHSEPVLVNYGGSSDNNLIFLSGNDGMLRGVESRTGKEVFSFMPHELFRQANRFTVDRPGLAEDNSRQLYGLDGSWTVWRRPGATPSASPRNVYLYGGMRRGGQSYYMIDASNPSSPEQVWRIDPSRDGYARLGQTWSQPTLTQVMVSGAPRAVLVFGGGYSPADHDRRQGQARRTSDASGNMIYVADARTGDLLWSAGAGGGGARHTTVPSMSWSIPSSISVVDMDFDGVADFFYYGDLGGQIFRIDVDQENIGDSEVRRVANLNTAGAAGNRRFYYPPAISYVRGEDGSENLYVAIGSGYRTHPLDENVDDYFYVIKDTGVERTGNGDFRGKAPSAVLAHGSLEELIDNREADTTGPGWKLPLVGDGEKNLSAPVVFGNRVFFTTYEPGSDELASNPCAVRIGTSYLYVMNLLTGQAAAYNNDGSISDSRRQQLRQDVPPPSPTLLSDGEQILVIVGTEVVGGEDLGNTGLRRGSWYQLQPNEPDRVPRTGLQDPAP
jgi:type IV pilus assembly protein PilY1